jgi:hypothetical protein
MKQGVGFFPGFVSDPLQLEEKKWLEALQLCRSTEVIKRKNSNSHAGGEA